jgi:two-component system, chemotaxis family, protein-glutamate methylesterase/glutaminase
MATTYELAVIGASWGGFHGVGALLRDLDPACTLAIAIGQHRAVGSDESFVRFLQHESRLPVEEVDDKVPIEPGRVYIAPPDYHLLVEPGHFSLSTEAPVRFSRPSIDVLFESAADAYGERLVAVVLTGANDDGCRGLARVKEAGGLILVQDPATAERREMPEAAIATGIADEVLPIPGLAAKLNELGKSS